MRKRTNTGGIFRQIPFVVLMLAALVFSVSNSLQPLLYEEVLYKEVVYEGAKQTDQQQPEQEQSDDNRPVAFVDYACAAITPVAQLLFFQASFKVPVPALQLWPVKIQLIPSPRGSDHFFRTLFRSIISPNAP